MNKKERIEQAFPGIHQAVIDFNGWQGAASVMLDLYDHEVWTDVFASDTEWICYHSSTIVKIASKGSFWGRNGKISVASLLFVIGAEGCYWPSWYIDIRDDPELKCLSDKVIEIVKNII